MTDKMQETMDEIERLDGQTPKATKDSLLSEILVLEKSIGTAETEIIRSSEEPYGFTPVTPEQANKSHRDVVFLKKQLVTKKLEYELFA